MKNDKLLYRKLFLVSIFLLLLNDLYLKEQFHNFLTGKLSDFVGLFAFSYFFSVLFIKNIKLIYVLTGILFIFWKSSSSQFVIDYLHNFGIGFDRIVDYSDLFALLVLPLGYRYRIQNSIGIEKMRFLPKPIIIGICSFAFMATSLQKEFGELNLKSDYTINAGIPKDSILKLIRVNPITKTKYHTNLEFPNKRSYVRISLLISELENNSTKIELDSILSFTTTGTIFSGASKKNMDYLKNLRVEDYEKEFIEQKIKRNKIK